MALVLMSLCLIAVAAQMYALADRAVAPSPAADIDPGVPAVAGGTEDPVNEFIPADRDISECISAIPKPGCGSDARGGWRQSLVLLAILAGLALIVWRIVAGARKAKAARVHHVGAGH